MQDSGKVTTSELLFGPVAVGHAALTGSLAHWLALAGSLRLFLSATSTCSELRRHGQYHWQTYISENSGERDVCRISRCPAH